jgi:hypothetical protein
LRPRYQVLIVNYAPPGSASGRASSKVAYGQESSAGTTVTTSSSFRTGTSISADLSANAVFAGTTDKFSMDFAGTSTDSASIDVTKSKSTEIDVSGATNKDGIDHDDDLYYLWLNPVLKVTVWPGQVRWGYDPAGSPMQIAYVSGRWLKNPATMPHAVQASLASAGITPAEYPHILSTNPFSMGGTAIDVNRFVLTDRTIPYEPVSANDLNVTQEVTLENEITGTSGKKIELEYQVGFILEGDAGFGDLLKASLSSTTTFTWTITGEYENQTMSKQSASATIASPSESYRGSIFLLVYRDTMHNTFMFAFAPETMTPLTTGTVTSAGKPIARQEVTLIAGGHTFHTVTNSKGDFRIYGRAVGAGTLSVRDKTFPTKVGIADSKVNIQL